MPRKSIDRYLGMVTIYKAGLDYGFACLDQLPYLPIGLNYDALIE